MSTIENISPKNIISAEKGALMVIDVLYAQGKINKKTYENIKNKYKTQ